MPLRPWKHRWTALAVGATLAWSPVAAPLAFGRQPTPAAPKNADPAAAANTLISKDAYELTRKSDVRPADLEKILELCQKGIDDGASPKMKTYGESLMAWALNRRGQNWLDQQQHEAALADFNRAIELDPARHLPYHNRGYVHASQGDVAGAMADFNKTIELKPDFVKGWINRGELYYVQGEWIKAASDYSEALRLQPRQPDVQNQRGHAYYRAGKRQLALQDYSRAIQLDPSLVDAYINRGDLYSDVGYVERAANDYRRAIQLDDKSHRAYVSAAWLMATCGDADFRDVDLAMQSAEKALEILPKDDPFRHRYLDVLAAAQANALKFDDATKTEAEAIAAAPAGVKGDYEKRLALYQKKEPYRDVLKSDPTVKVEEQAATP